MSGLDYRHTPPRVTDVEHGQALVDELWQVVVTQREQIERLHEQVQGQALRIERLEEQVRLHSGDSSTPPSSALFFRARSLAFRAASRARAA